ncbi:formylglycine-generating enzyme family protein [Tumebacillus permanentifrigoris]|uniref:Formylglycine-generating enzyme required for sulfatase activity n=1 Tax=Tumebacillus permanentifrigoris TaxID=378543 RepID=A0A316DRW3_9BACL|nr:SUMF1/EgtB/PvdO family nonheme iron enzyme [Tumebacillus permanentifrigoris]PWK07888.1 formylglycine-generating enzyme required for sulfatase activity [Tumebacillus permanentifrigoris]
MLSLSREDILNNLQFVSIPAGTFLMGTTWDRNHMEYLMEKYTVFVDWFIKEVPQRELELPAYDIAEIPVTFDMMRAFIRETDYPVKRLPELLQENLRTVPGDHPVYPTTAGLSEDFCKWLTKNDDGYTYDLPTEEEWEKAARGTDSREFPWGDAEQPQRINTRECGHGHVLPVRHTSKANSPYGLYDIAGNVEEMTRSFNAPYEGMPIQIPDYLKYRILRGGTAEHLLDLARCARRHGKHPSRFTGFRVVRRPQPLLVPNKPTPFLLKNGDWIYASINYVNDQEVCVDLGNQHSGIAQAKEFTEHDFHVFANLHSRSEIILKVMDVASDIVVCHRPNMDELDRFMQGLSFNKVMKTV